MGFVTIQVQSDVLCKRGKRLLDDQRSCVGSIGLQPVSIGGAGRGRVTVKLCQGCHNPCAFNKLCSCLQRSFQEDVPVGWVIQFSLMSFDWNGWKLLKSSVLRCCVWSSSPTKSDSWDLIRCSCKPKEHHQQQHKKTKSRNTNTQTNKIYSMCRSQQEYVQNRKKLSWYLEKRSWNQIMSATQILSVRISL